MVEKRRFTPVLSASAGAAVSYYCAGLFGWGGRIVLAAFFTGCVLFFRVLAEAPSFFYYEKDRRNRTFKRVHSLLLAFSAGLCIGTGAGASMPQGPFPGLREETVAAVSGRLAEDPRATAGGRGLGLLDLAYAVDRAGVKAGARGELPVYFPEESLPGIKEFGRGCVVYVEGSFAADAAGRPYFRAGSVHVVKAAPPLETWRTGVRKKLTERAGASQGGWGGLSLALLLGIKDNLDSTLASSYRDAGCSHVLALSGMHLAIISAVVVFLLKKPLGVKAAAVSGALFVLAYVFIVGPQPSLGRAAIMYLLGTLAVLGNFHRNPLNLLGMSFLIQIAVYPGSGTSVSFILSYLALFGILLIGESLHELGRGKIPEILLGPLSASIGAFIAAAPVTVYWFGVLRPAGILAGLLVVPLATAFMAGSLAFLALGFISPVLGEALVPLLSGLYRAQDMVVRTAAAVPGMAAPDPLPVLAAALAFTLFLLYFEFRIKRRWNRITPPVLPA
ncbi:MAG: ComEC/Rec2 family competence protein [Treponema sp.]|jgi:competence protein ComEC|nr:ComEC/Rec2 family competence protein [Treponema sp.]